MKLAAVIVAALGLGTAPFQCASDPDPNRRMEDSAPEALWELSERFEDRGDDGARRETLRHLIERYPSSRYARRAELALDASDEAAPADTASDAP